MLFRSPDVIDGRFGPDFATTAAFGFALCLALIFVRGVALCFALVFPFGLALGFAAVVAPDFVGGFAVPLPGRLTTGAPVTFVLFDPEPLPPLTEPLTVALDEGAGVRAPLLVPTPFNAARAAG